MEMSIVSEICNFVTASVANYFSIGLSRVKTDQSTGLFALYARTFSLSMRIEIYIAWYITQARRVRWSKHICIVIK